MGWEEWTDEQWEAFIERNQVAGGTVERVPAFITLHCRGCKSKMSRDRDGPLMQLCYVREDSSSFHCVSCARKLPPVPPQVVRRQREPLGMAYDPMAAEGPVG
jgi:hypothetical protein